MTYAASGRGLLVCAALAIASFTASAQSPGSADYGFGTAGQAFVNIGAPVSFQLVATVKQPDGKVVIGGNAALAGECGGLAFARFNVDGTPDTTYGTNGWLTYVPSSYCYGQPTTLQAMAGAQYGGEVAFVGRSEGSFIVGAARGDYNNQVFFQREYQVPASFVARAMAPTYGDGYIVAGSDAREPAGTPGRVSAFLRLAGGGYVDWSFGTNGILKQPFGTESDEAIGVAVDYDNSWWAAGTARDAGSTTGSDMYVARFLSSGALDAPWGGNGDGRRIVDFGGLDDVALSFTRDQQQQLLVAGSATVAMAGPPQRLPALVRLRNDTGELYPAFDSGGPFGPGKSVVPIDPNNDGEFSGVFSPGWTDNVAAGTLVDRATGVRRTIVYRFDNTGSWSYSFGAQGAAYSTALTEPRGAFLGDGYSQTFFLAGTSRERKAMLAKYDMYGADPSYGNGVGRAFDVIRPDQGDSNTNDEGGAMALLADGRIVIVGQARTQGSPDEVRGGVARITADGQRDPSFGTSNGVAYLEAPAGTMQFFPRAVAAYDDGRIVVGSTAFATSEVAFLVARLLPDGSRDPSWNGGNDTVVVPGPGSFRELMALAVQPDGAVVGAGYTDAAGNGRMRVVLFRLLADGSTDYSFGSGGQVALPGIAEAPSETANGLLLGANGSILVAAQLNDGSGNSRFALLRLLPNGALDPAWGSGGKAFGPTAGAAFGIATQPDGKIVASGDCDSGTSSCIARFLASGELDSGFGSSGVAPFFLGTTYNGFVGVAVQPDGKIVAGGDGGVNAFTLARVRSNGQPDASFGSSGYAYALTNARARGFAMTPEGKLLIGGANGDLALVRHHGGGDDSPDAFAIPPAMNVALSSLIASAPVIPAGYDTATAVSVDVGEVAVGSCQTWYYFSTSITPGQALCVRHTSSSEPGGSVTSTVTIGDTTATFTSTTLALDTTITSQPSSPTGSEVSFGFTASDAAATFECHLDGAAFQPCTSPKLYGGLAGGLHTFEVRAVLGTTVDATPATATFTVDATAPQTTIVDGPNGPTASRDATFVFTSDDLAATFECRLDGAAFAPCTSGKTYTGLAEGAHTFEVSAIDAVGNRDMTPASRAWTVDTVAPDTTIMSAPPAATNSPSAQFTFVSEAGASFECQLDGAAFAACASPLAVTVAPNAAHTIRVRAIDAVGNVDASPAEWSWTVDTLAPETTITSGPTGNNNPDTATFLFTSSEPGSTFECRLDDAAFSLCTSGITYTALARAQHVFEVRARDAAGNVDASPATSTWRSH